jgi:hypothetical protein
MNWNIKDTTSKKAGLFEMLTTFIMFVVGGVVGICVYPFGNYYLYNNSFPGSQETKDIFNALWENVYSILLAFVVGSALALLIIFGMRFGRYIATFVTEVEQILVYCGLFYLSNWILYKVNNTPGTIVFSILPFFIYMIAAVITLELAAIFGQSGRVAYNFVSLGAILGCFIGTLRSVDMSYFPIGSVIALNNNLGISFARAAVDTTFFFGACALAAAAIVRSKVGGSFLWHIVAWLLPCGLACAFATSAQIAYGANMEARWVVASLVSVITNLLALAVFSPVRKMAPKSTKSQAARPCTCRGKDFLLL